MFFPIISEWIFLILDHCELTQLLSSNADFQFRIKTDRLLLASLPTRYLFQQHKWVYSFSVQLQVISHMKFQVRQIPKKNLGSKMKSASALDKVLVNGLIKVLKSNNFQLIHATSNNSCKKGDKTGVNKHSFKMY